MRQMADIRAESTVVNSCVSKIIQVRHLSDDGDGDEDDDSR